MEDDERNRRTRHNMAIKGGVALVLVAALVGAGELLALSFVREGGRAVVSHLRDVPDEGLPSAPVPEDRLAQNGSSHHTTGIVVALDPDGFSFMIEVEESTEDIVRGAHVMADCAHAETSPFAFSDLEVGMRVGIRSVQAHAADGTVPVQRFSAVVGEDGAVQTEDVPEAVLARPALTAEVEKAFAASGCGFRIVGTLASSVDPEGGSFDLRVDGGAVVEAGKTVEVRVDELKTVIGDESMLVKGASGVTVGMSRYPEDGVLHAKALVVAAV